MTYDVEVLDEAFPDGYDEDGRVRYTVRYRLLLTNRAGRSWMSKTCWNTKIAAEDTAGLARYMLGKGRRLNASHWEEIAPTYGSPVWQREAHRWEGIPEE